MTARRRLLVFGLLAGLIVLGGSVWLFWLIWPRTAITRENAAKIQVGMMLEEVEVILGGPARCAVTKPMLVNEPYHFSGPHMFQPLADPTNQWATTEFVILLDFDMDSRVARKRCFAICPFTSETYMDKVRRWLRL